MVVSDHGTAMHTTSASLLKLLRKPDDTEAWSRFVRLYSPMLYGWARRMGLQDADAVDLLQEVFATLLHKLPEFSYDNHKRFRGWLLTVTRNKWIDMNRRRPLPIDGSSNPAKLVAPEDDALIEEDFRRHLLTELMPMLREHFQPATWQAFWETVVNEKPPAEVAKQLGISLDSVYQAKVRVLARMNREFADLM